MEFKSLFFRKSIQIINYEPNVKGSFDDFEVIEIKFFDDNFLCFRIERLQDPGKYGVMNVVLNESVSLKEKLENQPIRLQDFVIIDQKNKDIYYTGSKANVEDIIRSYFNISKKDIISRISLDNLKFLSEIKIVEYPNAPVSLFVPENEVNVAKEISDLFIDSAPYDCIEHKYKLRNGNFNRDKLSALLEKNLLNNTCKFSLEGEDECGNRIKYNDGIFARKFEILTEERFKDYETRKNTPLEFIKNELKKVIT